MAAKAATTPDLDPADVAGRLSLPGLNSSSLIGSAGDDDELAMGRDHSPGMTLEAAVAAVPRPEDDIRWKKDRNAWHTFVKTDVVKAVRAHGQVTTTLQKLSRGVSAACAREARKRSLRSVRAADDANRRSRRLLKDVLTYWRREERERVEERRRLAAETEALRTREDELREEQRQKNKLRFLLGQSEAFSSFLQAKAQATSAAAAADKAGAASAPSVAAAAAPPVDASMDSITGTEDDAELRRKSEAAASELLVAHRAKLAQFDNETVRQRSISDTAAADRAADEARHADDEGGLVAPTAANAMDGVTPAATEGHTPASAAAAEAAAAEAAAAAMSLAGSDNKQVAAVKQPSILLGKMKGYQLRGLSWLVSLYDQGINGILADEMGLGKTVQTISFLAYLAEAENNWGPFLVVTPKATLHNWQQEVGKFCPSLRVLPYWGSKADRQELRKHWSQKRMYRRDSEFHVCVTSYETLMTDQTHFPRVKWQHVVLDEAQAIKNSASARWKALLNFPCRNRLLLTGTPLQNKMSELWSLLHFIMPTVFDSHTEFADWFAKDIEGHAKNASSMLDSTTLARLRTLLDPFMLRRVKRDVENEMPPKTELVVHCDLTPRQRKLYAGIKANISVEELRRTLGVNSGGGGGTADASEKGQLMNIIMQLRKVCNHPETFQRRTPTAPLQFQRSPPPSISPLPPAVLTNKSDGPPPPQTVTLVRESALSLSYPSLVQECLALAEAERQKACVVTCGPLTPARLTKQWFPPAKTGSPATPVPGGSLSALRLAGGLSPTEIFAIAGVLAPVYGWHRITAGVVEGLDRLRTVYGSSDDEGVSCGENPLDVPHRRLLLPMRGTRGAGGGGLAPILLPGHESPAQMVEVHTRLLRVTRIHVPAATAPPAHAFVPGDASHAAALRAVEASAYPSPPVDSGVSVAENYALWRGLSGNYGGAVGTSSISMPDRGRLVADSGKMQVLDALLRRLKREGHKVLVYSQFTKVMDILENYVQTTGFKYVRLDGQSALADRRDMVAEWQTDDDLFVFLLSTRAGGVGINLTAADTVIFFDSDWNPTVDSQAMDRAHRLGQERPVTVYRLLARGTIEDRIRSRALQKERINDLVIKGGQIAAEADQADADTTNLRDLAALLMGEDDIDDKVQQLAGVSVTTVATTPGSASVPVAA